MGDDQEFQSAGTKVLGIDFAANFLEEILRFASELRGLGTRVTGIRSLKALTNPRSLHYNWNIILFPKINARRGNASFFLKANQMANHQLDPLFLHPILRGSLDGNRGQL